MPASSVTGSPSTIPSNKTWLKRSTTNVGQAESVVNFKNKKSRTLDKETLSQSTTCLFGPDEGRGIIILTFPTLHLFLFSLFIQSPVFELIFCNTICLDVNSASPEFVTEDCELIYDGG